MVTNCPLVAVWALLGIIWQFFQAITEGLGEAAAIRVAYHLGKGNSVLASLSSARSIFLAIMMSFYVTSVLFLANKSFAGWFTSDLMLQSMMQDLVPLLGVGNIVMTMSMVAWSLVGAQGRYRLGTLLMLLSSWMVTIPLALISVYGFYLDLQGVVSAIVIGHSSSSIALVYVLLRSDWKRLARMVVELSLANDGLDSSLDDKEGLSVDDSSL
mmetsp:Transcript_26006/g.39834  ORF Transcript_26006/g.39834 Transcript_26006/m.39834 type:complete len:213 (-) Transcript_26006:399-1037(-)